MFLRNERKYCQHNDSIPTPYSDVNAEFKQAFEPVIIKI